MSRHFKADPVSSQPNVKVGNLMVRQVMTAGSNQSVGHGREVLREHRIQALPVLDKDGKPIGIITASDLLEPHSDSTPMRNIMTQKVFVIPEYEEPEIAARIMRNHHIHHLVVTNEKKVVGILSTFDLLQLLEGRRFRRTQAPTTRQKAGGMRKKSE